MVVVKIDSMRGSYSIVKSKKLKTILDYIDKAYKAEEIKNIRVLHKYSKSIENSAMYID